MVEQGRRQPVETIHLSAHRFQELLPVRFVHLLFAEELQRAGKSEDRRSELMRGVGNELAARLVQLRQALTHALETACELSDLVVTFGLDRLLQRASGNPVGATLEAVNARGETARTQF